MNPVLPRLRSSAALTLGTLLTSAPLVAQIDVRGTNVSALESLSIELAARMRSERLAAEEWSLRTGHPLRVQGEGGWVREIVGIRDGRPVIYATHNQPAADTISTDELWPLGSSGLGLMGNPVTLHMWDGGLVRTTHFAFAGRVTQADGAATADDHATHVAGTMVADPGPHTGAQGMAFQAALRSYDWNADQAEMAAAAALAANPARISNHSYSYVAGWDTRPSGQICIGGVGANCAGGVWHIPWHGDVRRSVNEDINFGLYDATSVALDQIAFNARSYLIVKAAGNDRGDTVPAGTPHVHWDSVAGGWVVAADAHPADGGANGFDTIPADSCAKNILTVGAVDRVAGGYANAAGVVQAITRFSGWGPTDDGRIKPDVVACGARLNSTVAFVPGSNPPVASNLSFDIYNGTSMAAPCVSGTLGLLMQHYRATRRNLDMRSSQAKALLIHTADEAGPSDGPDYQFGWGLVNAKRAGAIVENSKVAWNSFDVRSIENGVPYSASFPYAGGGEPFRVTICWTDPAGTANTGLAVDPPGARLVNDLDLRVTDPNGVVHQPWTLDPRNPGNAAVRGDNTRDNAERVDIANAPAGRYTITVTHKGALRNGPQEFGYVVPMDRAAGRGVPPGVIAANAAQANPPGLAPAAVGAGAIRQVQFVKDAALIPGFVRCSMTTDIGLRTGIYNASLGLFAMDPPSQWLPLNVSGRECGLNLNPAASRVRAIYPAGTVAVWDYDLQAPQAPRCATRTSTSAPWTVRGPIAGVPASSIDPTLAIVRGELWLLWVQSIGANASIVGAPFDPLVPGLSGTPIVIVSDADHIDLRAPHSPAPITGPDGDSELLVYDAALPNTTNSDPHFKARLESSAPAFEFASAPLWSNGGGHVGGTLFQAFWPGSTAAYHLYDVKLAMLTGDDEMHTRGQAGRTVDIGILAPITRPGEMPWFGMLLLELDMLPYSIPLPPFVNELVLPLSSAMFAMPPIPGPTGEAAISVPITAEFPPGTLHLQGILLRPGSGGLEGGWTNNVEVAL